MPASASAWSTFPSTYREREVQLIESWASTVDSGLIVGLSGSGKSNLTGFMSYRLSSRPETLCPLVDLNRLPEPSLVAFMRQLLAALEDASAHIELPAGAADRPRTTFALPAGAADRLRATFERGLAQTDSFLLTRSLDAALLILCGEMALRTVIVIDRFDIAIERFGSSFYNNLRAWRDAHKARLSYLVSTRRDWPDWPNQPSLSEFTDLIAGRTCWVGSLALSDVRWNLARFSGQEPSEELVTRMADLSGGHPGLLKTLWGAGAGTSATRPAREWAAQSGVQRQCQELWDDLPADAQEALRAWQRTGIPPQDKARVFLLNTGLIAAHAANSELRLASPVFGAFVGDQAGITEGKLWRDAATGQVYRGNVRLPLTLTPQEDRLLAYLLSHPGEVCDKDALAEAVWPEQVRIEGVRDDRLAQLIRRLRDKVEPDPREPHYILPVWGRGYRLAPDGSGQSQ